MGLGLVGTNRSDLTRACAQDPNAPAKARKLLLETAAVRTRFYQCVGVDSNDSRAPNADAIMRRCVQFFFNVSAKEMLAPAKRHFDLYKEQQRTRVKVVGPAALKKRALGPVNR